jgi:hypothetical protein
MALNIVIDEVTVTGFVNKILGDKGFELARPISKKNDAGQWEEVGKNYFKVWINPVTVEVNQRVDVVGRLSVRETEYEGKTRVELHVSATSVFAAVKRGQSAPAVDVSAPF